MLAAKQLFSASLLNMNGQLRISSHVIKASSMKGNNPSEDTGKGNSEESEAMQGAEEGFEENVAKSSEIRERHGLQEKKSRMLFIQGIKKNSWKLII